MGLVTQSVSLYIGYSYYLVRKPTVGSALFPTATHSYRRIIPYVMEAYERIVKKDNAIRKVSVTCKNIMNEVYEQYDLFTDYTAMKRERNLQKATLEIKRRFGKNAIVRGMDLLEEGTVIEQNRQIGRYKSGE